MKGKIVKILSNDYTVKASGRSFVCKARGKFRKDGIVPLVGDECICDCDKKYIVEILPRRTELVRPMIANVDQAFIITSVKEPDFSSNLLDKLLCIVEYNNITPIICFTKLDLLNDDEYSAIEDIIAYYRKIGYVVFKNTDIASICKIFQSKVTVFTGQSGAGKSTLLNRLDSSLNLKTDGISKALGRGKHTTRHVELMELCGGLIADTPGFSSLSFLGLSNADIRDNFIEFNIYRDKCRYKDCMHVSEVDCEVKRELLKGNILKSRYENYLKILKR